MTLNRYCVYSVLIQCLLAFPRNNKTYVPEVKNCTIRPAEVVIPCTQFTFESDCSDKRLHNRFPELYNADENSIVEWPGNATNVHTSERTVTWSAPKDTTVHSLRGFQVLSQGISFGSFGDDRCTIIYFANNTNTRAASLHNVTFEVSIIASGEYTFQVQSLPLKRNHTDQPEATETVTIETVLGTTKGSTKPAVTTRRQSGKNTGNCTIHPSSSPIPCTVFTFEGIKQCSERNLQKRLPEVYARDESNTANWPASPTHILLEDKRASMRNITWKPPLDASIRYLRGFQIRLEGSSFESFETTLCAVVYLSSSEENRISSLMNVTFEVSFQSPGDFNLEIKSLPLPSKSYNTQQPPIPLSDTTDYHPNITVDMWSVQLNESAVNVTIDVSPEPDNITSYFLEAFYRSNNVRDIPELIQETIPAEKKYAVLANLRLGNYTLKFRPKEEFPDNDNKCICYTGLPNRRSCTLCRSYLKDIQITSLIQNTKEDQDISFLEFGLPIIVTFALVLAVLVVCMLLRRGRLFSCYNLFRKGTSEKRSIFLLYAWDHESHDAVVKVFISYLKERFDCVVLTQTELQQISNQTENGYEQLIAADAIIIIQSEAAYRLYSVFETDCICNFSRTFGATNDSFILFTTKLLRDQRKILLDKTVSVLFNYTSNELVIADSRIKVYRFLDEIQQLEQHLKRQLNQKHLKSADDAVVKELANLTERCKTFQNTHPFWFSELYREITKSSISSDDSGVDIQKDLIYNYSVKTDCCSVSRHFNQNITNTHRRSSLSLDTGLRQFCRSASTQGDNSFRFSEVERRFISPEFGDEKEDTPTVVLAEQMREINERYDYIVSNNLEVASDSFENLGTSV